MNKVKLGDLAIKISSGLTPSRANIDYWKNGTIDWIKTEQIGQKYVYSSNEKISNLALEKTSIKLNPINTLSIAMYGEGKTRGSVSILKVEATTNQACCNIIVDDELADTEFLYYKLKTQYENLRSLSSGVRKNLNSNDIKEFEISIPKLLTQQKIAAVLSALDDKIEVNNKINAELEAMAKTLYDYWFVQFDFPFDFAQDKPNTEGKPYKSSGGKMVFNETLKREIPEGWEVKTIGDVIGKIESGKRPKGGIDKSLKNGIPSLGAESIDRLGYFNYSNTKYIPFEYRDKIVSGIIQNNDILIYKDGAYVGKTTLFRDNFPFEFSVINEHVFLVRSIDPFFQEYLLFTLMQESYFNIMQSLGQKAAQPGLNQEDLKSIKIVIPPKVLTKEFNEKIDVFFKKLFINSKQNQELAQLRDWLLPMLMNGQVTVGEALEATEKQLAMVAEPSVDYKIKDDIKENRFALWLSNQKLAARGDIDEVVLREIFDAMDDEDQ